MTPTVPAWAAIGLIIAGHDLILTSIALIINAAFGMALTAVAAGGLLLGFGTHQLFIHLTGRNP